MASHCCNGDSLKLVIIVDIFNRKIVFEDHFTEQYFKKDWEHSLLGNSCTDIKPRTRSSPGQFHTVTVKRAQLSPNMSFFISLFFSIDTI